MSHTQLTPTVTAHLALTADDWAVATWRPRTPLERPAPRAFDPVRTWERLHRLLRNQAPYTPLNWSRANLTPALAPAEAHFWLYAMTTNAQHVRHPEFLAEVEGTSYTGHVTRDDLRTRLRRGAGFLTAWIAVPLASLLSPAELLDLLLDDQLCIIDPYHTPHYQIAMLQDALLAGFCHHVRPYLDEPALDQLRQHLRARLPASTWTQSAAPSFEQFLGYRLAPLIHLHRELATLVASWPDDLFPPRGGYDEWRRRPREIIFGLGDPWLVEQHTRRLKLYLRSEDDARAWLAHTETQALDWIRDSARFVPAAASHRLVDVLCLVQAPAAAPHLLELKLAGQSTPSLRDWFAHQVGNAVAGLLPLAGGRGKLGDAARLYLRDVKRRGLRGVIEEQLATVEPTLAARIRTTILDAVEATYPTIEDASTPLWLRRALGEAPTVKLPLPDWLTLDDLPPLVVAGRQLNPNQLTTVLRTLSVSKLDAPPRLLSDLRERVEASHREAFVWRLVELWQCAGASEAHTWAVGAVGFLGSDESVLKLVSLIRDAKGPSGRKRILRGLDALAAIGSPLAVSQLNTLARQVRSRPAREQARQLLERLAHTRGLSRVELEEAAVPNLGFTAEGGPTFDFGPRKFTAVLATGLRLLVRDGAGAVRTDLPEPGVRDEAGQAKRAMAEWRLLRKSVREVVKEQSVRFERAMVSGQRWAVRHFREGILGQPILQQLARLVLWAGYDDRRRLVRTFRYTDEGVFVDAQEKAVSLADLNSVRVVHPIELTAQDRQAWVEVWRDHELIAPFAQLGRRLHSLRDDERKQTMLTAFRGRRVAALTLAAVVKARDWLPVVLARGRASDGEAHAKGFRAWDLTAVVHHPNVGQYRYPNHRAMQELRAAYFLRGAVDPGEEVDVEGAVRLGEVQDLPYSEVCELLAELYGKGKEVQAR